MKRLNGIIMIEGLRKFKDFQKQKQDFFEIPIDWFINSQNKMERW